MDKARGYGSTFMKLLVLPGEKSGMSWMSAVHNKQAIQLVRHLTLSASAKIAYQQLTLSDTAPTRLSQG